MVPVPRLRFVSVRYFRYRASLHTGKAELTLVVPDWLFFGDGNVLCRVYAGAYPVPGAGFISMKIPCSLLSSNREEKREKMVRLTMFIRRRGQASRAEIRRAISIVYSVSLRTRSYCSSSGAGAYNTWQLPGIAIPHAADSFKPFFTRHSQIWSNAKPGVPLYVAILDI